MALRKAGKQDLPVSELNEKGVPLFRKTSRIKIQGSSLPSQGFLQGDQHLKNGGINLTHFPDLKCHTLG